MNGTRPLRPIVLFAMIAGGLLMVAAYLCWAWTDSLNDLGGDSAVYMLTASYFSPLTPASEVARYFAGTSAYPPLYPLALGLLGGAGSVLLAHQITVLFLLSGLAGLNWWLRGEQLGVIASFCLAAVAALIPGVYMQALYLHSEALFFSFVVLSIAALARYEQSQDRRLLLAAAAFAAAAALTRSVGMAMVVALIAWVLLHCKRDRLLACAVAVLPLLAWQMLAPSGGRTGYLESLSQRLSQDGGGGVAGIMARQAFALTDGWIVNLTGAGINSAIAMAIGLAWIAAVISRLWAKKPDALFVLFYLGILLLWPFPAERARFVMPLMPIALGQMALACARFKLTRGERSFSAAPLPAAVCLLIGLPNLLTSLSHFREPLPPDHESYRHDPEWYSVASRQKRLDDLAMIGGIVRSMRESARIVPAGECVFSTKPSLLGFYAGRVSHLTPLPQHAVAGGKPCRYIYIAPLVSPTYGDANGLLAAWSDKMEVVQITTLVPGEADSPIVGLLGRVSDKGRSPP